MRTPLALILTFCCVATLSAQVVPGQAQPQKDKYGGLLNVSTTATGHWYIRKFGTKWLLVDPDGHGFFAVCVEGISPNWDGGTSSTYGLTILAKYGDRSVTWAPQTIRRLKSLGINCSFGFNGVIEPAQPTATNVNWPDGIQPEQLPTIIDFDPIRDAENSGTFGYCATGQGTKDLGGTNNTAYFTSIPGLDPYDPCWNTFLQALMVDTTNGLNLPALFANPYVIGIQLGESDVFACLGYAGDFCASATLSASPLVAGEPPANQNSNTNQLYTSSRTFNAKSNLTSFLQGRYASIALLNASWGSSYTGFGSDGTNQTQTIGTGDGSTLTFSATLTNAPDGGATWVKVNGVVKAGSATTGCSPTDSLLGATVSSGSVNCTTKAITITFTGGNAPGNGQLVVVDYYTGGWGHGGQLLDEDGRHAWMPTSTHYGDLGGITAAMQADLRAFQTAYAKQFFKTEHDALKAQYPNALYFGSNGQGGSCTVPETSGDSLAAMPGILDAFDIQLPYCHVDANGQIINTSDTQTMVNYINTYAGDMPYFDLPFLTANQDSDLTGNANPGGAVAVSVTQKGKGANYKVMADFGLGGGVTATGNLPIIGQQVWAAIDDGNQRNNWGILSTYDNVYDGITSRNVGCTSGHPETCYNCIDSWGWSCGAEPTTSQTLNLGTGNGSQTSFPFAPLFLPIVPGTFAVSAGTNDAQTASDNFTRANANPLSGNGTCTWTTPGSFSVLQLASNNVEGTSFSNANAAYCSGPIWTANQYSEVTFGAYSGVAIGAAVRIQSSGTDAYVCVGSAQSLAIQRFQAGSLVSGAFTVSSGDVIRCEVVNNYIILKQNGTVRLSITDSTLISGNPGIYISGTQGSNTAQAITAWNGGAASLAAGCTENGTGVLVAGGTCAGGTIQYQSPGNIMATFSPAPASGVLVLGSYSQDGFGGLQPSYGPEIYAETASVYHTLELNLFSLPSAANPNLARNKPVAASSVLATVGGGGNNYLPRRATDGATNTTWQPAASDPQWIRVDMLGKPPIGKAILRWGTVYATAYTLDWSDDGISWTTAFTQSAGMGGVETDTFTAVSHRYWRMNETTRSGAGSLVLQELELYAQ